jgi:hypothetical protein
VFAASHLRRSLSEQAPTKKEPVITTSSSAFELCPDGLARLCGCFLFQKLFRLFNLLLIAGKFLLVSLLDFIIGIFYFPSFFYFIITRIIAGFLLLVFVLESIRYVLRSQKAH